MAFSRDKFKNAMFMCVYIPFAIRPEALAHGSLLFTQLHKGLWPVEPQPVLSPNSLSNQLLIWVQNSVEGRAEVIYWFQKLTIYRISWQIHLDFKMQTIMSYFTNELIFTSSRNNICFASLKDYAFMHCSLNSHIVLTARHIFLHPRLDAYNFI